VATSGVLTSALGAGRGAFDFTRGAGFLVFFVVLTFFFVGLVFFGAAFRFLGTGFFLAIVSSSFYGCVMVDELTGYWGIALSSGVT
jgi:hypothetical protein